MLTVVINVFRGAMMGVAEVIPGVSGGTIALIVGIYRSLIDALANGFLAIRQLLGLAGKRPSLSAATLTFRKLPWALLVPLLIGMATAFLVGARLIEPALEQYPNQFRALFFGLVLAGIYVPAHMVWRLGRWGLRDLLLVAPAFAAAFLVTGIPPENVTRPSLIFVFLAAAVAICAWILPGVSGSFFLYSVGLYQPMIGAINDRNLTYIFVFMAGALIGLGSFVTLLKWLLAKHTRVTLIVVVGLMMGSLRALWPWQGDGRELEAPSGDWPVVALFFLVGLVFVASLLWFERRLKISEEDVDLDAKGQPRPTVQ